MVGLRETLENAVRAAACSALGVADGLDRILNVPSRPFPLLGQLDDYTDAARDFYRDAVCPSPADNPYPPGGPTPIIPPNLGGQCPGVRYNVSYEVDFPLGGNPNNTVIGGLQNLVGPITGIRVQATNNVSQVVVEHGGTETNGIFETNSSANYQNPRFTAISRTDGSPDECPENVPEPPRVEDPIEYDPPDGGAPIQITPIITLPPVIISPTNNLIIPVGIAYANVRITAALNLNIGSVSFNFGGGSGGDKDCCLPPAPPDMPPADPDNPGPPADISVIQAVLITTTDIDQDTNVTEVFNDGGPSLFFPDIASVVFRVRAANVLPYLNPIKVQTRYALIECPYSQGAVDFSVVPRPGVTLTATPIYASVSRPGT